MRIINSMGSMRFSNIPAGMYNISAPGQNEKELAAMMQQGDALLVLEGGADIWPGLYGAEKRVYSYCNTSRDDWEIRLYNMARMYNVPILGICRGHQLMCALDGGTLYQDLRQEHGQSHSYEHRIIFSYEAYTSGFVDLMESCPTGSPNIVNSLHHQGIKDMPSHGIVLASAGDGIVEAVQYPWGISVQWHPEFLGHTEFLSYMQRHFVEKRDDNRVDNNGRGDRISKDWSSSTQGT